MSEVAELGAAYGDKPPPVGFGDAPPPRSGTGHKPIRVAVVGEFNSGKTTLVNALIGAAVLPTSFITHTAYPTVIRFASRVSLSAEVAGRRRVAFAWEDLAGAPSHHIHRLHIGMPLERLKALRITDTPGLGLGDPVVEERTLRACRSADLVIWCTPAMQAWKASEQHVWMSLPRSLRRRGILAVTFMDALNTANDATRLLMRLRTDASDLFGRIVTTSDHNVQSALVTAEETVG
ncbi:MAG TPA: dynamin family protein [Hyphomicrobiaceae bacterium]|nr:dynamin family protein [Hyphomicrobiaceae bacterium]